MKEKNKKIIDIPIEKILPNPYQPRKKIDEAKVYELSKSIRGKGLLQPITVRKKRDYYEVAMGWRRVLACKQIGYTNVPSLIRNLSDQEMLETAIIENIQRKELNPIEEAEAFKGLQEKFKLPQNQIAQKVGKTRDYIAQRLRLLSFPPILQKYVSHDTLSPSHAEALARLDNPDILTTTVESVVNEQLTVKQTQKLVQDLLQTQNQDTCNLRKEKTPVEDLDNITSEVFALFEKGKTPENIVIDLKLPPQQIQTLYNQYQELKGLDTQNNKIPHLIKQFVHFRDDFIMHLVKEENPKCPYCFKHALVSKTDEKNSSSGLVCITCNIYIKLGELTPQPIPKNIKLLEF